MEKGQIVFVNSWAPDHIGVFEGVITDSRVIQNQPMIEVKTYIGEFGASLTMSFPPNQIHSSVEDAVMAFELQASSVLDQLEMMRGQMGEKNFSECIATLTSARYDAQALMIQDRAMRILNGEPIAA